MDSPHDMHGKELAAQILKDLDLPPIDSKDRLLTLEEMVKLTIVMSLLEVIVHSMMACDSDTMTKILETVVARFKESKERSRQNINRSKNAGNN